MKMKCTKCGIKEADPKYIVERDTAYCSECASLLRLGTSREALKMDQGIPRSSAEDDEAKTGEDEVEEAL